MFELVVRVPHEGADVRCDATLLARRHDVRVREFLDSVGLRLVAAIDWHKRSTFTRAVCVVTAYPEVRAA